MDDLRKRVQAQLTTCSEATEKFIELDQMILHDRWSKGIQVDWAKYEKMKQAMRQACDARNIPFHRYGATDRSSLGPRR